MLIEGVELGWGPVLFLLVSFGLAFFCGRKALFAGFAADFRGAFAPLRFEPTLEPESFFSEFQEIGEGAAEGSFMGGPVAQEEVELILGGSGREVCGKASLLEAEGALVEPIVAGHVVHEHRFRGGGGLVLFAQVRMEFVKFVLAFVRQEAEGAGQAVAEIVLGGGRLASFCDRTRGKSSIFPVCFELAL